MKKIIIILFTMLSITAMAQTDCFLEQQTINDSLMVKTHFQRMDNGQMPKLFFEFINTKTNTTETIESEMPYDISNKDVHTVFINKKLGFISMVVWSYGTWINIYKTENGGKSWTQAIDVYDVDYLNTSTKISFFNEENGMILIQMGNQYSCYTTIDGGTTWKKSIIYTDEIEKTKLKTVDTTPNGTVTVTLDNGVVLKSTDFGKTFVKKNMKKIKK